MARALTGRPDVPEVLAQRPEDILSRNRSNLRKRHLSLRLRMS